MVSNITMAQYQIGIQGGVNYSVFYDRATTPNYRGVYDSNNSFYTAINYKERKPTLLNWVVELSYHRKSAEFDFFYGEEDFWIDKEVFYKIEMAHISLLPEFSFGKKTRFFVYGGPSFGWVVKSSVKGSGKSLSYIGRTHEWTEEGSAKVDFNGPDIDLRVGLGVERPINDRFNVFVGAQFAVGIVSLVSGSLEHYSDYISSVDARGTIGVSYLFNKMEKEEKPDSEPKN